MERTLIIIKISGCVIGLEEVVRWAEDLKVS
jgi:hypothetical protein